MPVIGVLGGAGPRQGPKRVTRTGIALVHENEIVYPAAGSAAEAISAIGDAQGSVQVYFPVQIEIRSAVGASEGGQETGSLDALTDDIAASLEPD